MTTRKITGRKSVTALNREFERARAAFKAIPSNEGNPSEHKRWERALDRAWRAGDRVITTRAETIEEMLIKSRVIAWQIDGLTENGDLAKLSRRKLEIPATIALIALGKDLSRIAKRLNVAA